MFENAEIYHQLHIFALTAIVIDGLQTAFWEDSITLRSQQYLIMPYLQFWTQNDQSCTAAQLETPLHIPSVVWSMINLTPATETRYIYSAQHIFSQDCCMFSDAAKSFDLLVYVLYLCHCFIEQVLHPVLYPAGLD